MEQDRIAARRRYDALRVAATFAVVALHLPRSIGGHRYLFNRVAGLNLYDSLVLLDRSCP